MIPDQIIYQASAIVGASGFVGGAVEAYRTRKAVERNTRTLHGTEYRKGLVQRFADLQRRLRGETDA
ncbi:hypothetical protein [Haloarcula onubensis]|uniref:Uncharacterized protein n=1 Tax=Haloarcula onubensis TaxID=2950539 RepID=A0ABU2FIS5_9EURY|nr:hypothetical protein [Halomicroarcula sp. S3CR25-11]MDS0280632.1 hypothetical protein [Halomicroarcula sp. S3CR25-11]